MNKGSPKMRKNEGIILITFAGVLYGFVTVGASILSSHGLSMLDISFFFLFLSLFPLAPFAARKGSLFFQFSSNWRYLTFYSLVNTCLLLSQLGSIALGLPPATVALLLYTQPAWTVIFGRVFFQERINGTRIIIIILALVGAFLVTDPIVFLQQFTSS